MLEEQDRVLPAQARTEQADRVGGIRGDRDFPAGRVDEVHLVGLAMPWIARAQVAPAS